ncbi:MAG TPA: SpoIIE family protein phosphatase [Acidimicrobiales bacterium]|nr:SpoIIE family protein phosphatase [Acidimicrobiales bacterium]
MAVGHRGLWTLRRRIAAVMVLLAATTAAFGAWIGWWAWDARAAVRHEQQSLQPATAGVEALLASFVDQEAGARGYALTGQPADLRAYRRGGTQSARLARALRTDLAGHPAALADLAEVDARYRAWRLQVGRPEVTGGRPQAGSGDAQHLWGAVADLQRQVATATRQADDAVDGLLGQELTLAIVGAGILLVVVAAGLALLHRWINEPVERLADDVKQMAGGALDRPVAPQGPPELAALGHDVEEMRRRLRDEGDELRQLRQALAEHSPLHVMLHSELEPSAAVPASAGRLLPAEGVLAGDWYDLWDRGPSGLAAAVVDISGHGPAAGLFALKVKHLLTPPIRSGAPPGEALAFAADECAGTDEQFATGIVVEVGQGVCRYANAGHPSGLLFSAAGVRHLGPTGPLLCAFPGAWRTEQLPATAGDLVVLVTDGVTEARLPDGREFGLDGVIDVVGRLGHHAPPDQVAEAVVSAVRDRCRKPLKDDVTVVAIRVR